MLSYLIVTMVISGLIGVICMFASSVFFEDQRRTEKSIRMFNKVENFVMKPKILCDSIASSIDTNVVNFETISRENYYDFVMKSTMSSFEKLNSDIFTIYASDANYQYFALMHFVDGQTIFAKAIGDYDNLTFLDCLVNSSTGNCLTEFEQVMLKKETMQVYKSRNLTKKQWLPSYFVNCPHETLCKLSLSYIYPIIKNGKYDSLVGFSFEERNINSFLKSLTDIYSFSFIMETKTGKLIGSNDETKIPIFDKENLIQFYGVESENLIVQRASKFVFSRNISELETGSDKIGDYFIDYARITDDDNLDWLIITCSPILQYYFFLIIFVVSYGLIIVITASLCLLIGIVVVILIKSNLKKLKLEMRKAEFLEFSKIKKVSFFKEVKEIENSFWFIKTKFTELIAFLPDGIRLSLKDKYNNIIGSDHSELNGNDIISKKRRNSSNTTNTNGSHTASYFSESEVSLENLAYNFQKKVTLKEITLVLITMNNDFQGKHSDNEILELVESHSEILELVQNLSQRGTIINFGMKKIYIGFNLDVSLVDHPKFGINFAVEFWQKINELEEKKMESRSNYQKWKITISVETGNGKMLVLGTNTTKVQKLCGKVKEKVKKISNFCRVHNNSNNGKLFMLIGEKCVKKYLESSNISIFRFSAIDKYLPLSCKSNEGDNIKKENFENLYFAQTIPKARTEEWKYIFEKKEEKEYDSLIWKLLNESKYDEVLRLLNEKEMKEYLFWKEAVLILKEKKLDFLKICENCKKNQIKGTLLDSRNFE